MNKGVVYVVVFKGDHYLEYLLEEELEIEGSLIRRKNETIQIERDQELFQIQMFQKVYLTEEIKIMCYQKGARYFERENKIWISSEPDTITVFGLKQKIYIESNILYNNISRDSATIFKNGERISGSKIEIESGDIFFIHSVFIIFSKDQIEVVGNEENYHTKLSEVRKKNTKFYGFPVYHRSPRIIKKVKEETIQIQNPPNKAVLSKSSLIQIILPPIIMICFTIIISVVLKRGAYILMSAGMTVITLVFSISQFFKERKETKEKNLKRTQVYEEYLLKVRKKIRKAQQEERGILNYQNPSIIEIEKMINSYSSRLYEKVNYDEDYFTVCLGFKNDISKIQISTQQNEIQIESDQLVERAKEVERQYKKVQKVPVVVDLKKAHLGLVGEKQIIHEQLKIILAQLTFFQSYHDCEIVFIHNEKYNQEFSYLKWYPHLRLKTINVYGEISNERIRDQILGSINQILKERKVKQDESKQEIKYLPHFLFVIDEPVIIYNHPVMEILQAEKHTIGFSVIYTTNQKANLPENIHTVCIYENSQTGRLLLDNRIMVDKEMQLDRIAGVDLEIMARKLFSIEHVKGMQSHIPESITFFEMYQIENPKELESQRRWNENEAHKTLAVPLGVRAENDYVELNLHEKAHGPHGLVAGTTGSGKSEIVQSYILSLAVNYHPYEVGFLLIDYKGGGMAGLFANLPHLLGTITNLDGAESTRAMASIKSELARRQKIFNMYNVNHINGYHQLFKLGEANEPLPHLFLISDEFAELKKEQPEFMSELVSTARIGRSLGIHLILATQKPSGVVDDQIWTNSKFKLCLKVQNEADSREMLKTPDAANIVQAGRSYLQVGNNEIYELFQSAWSGAAYTEDKKSEEVDERVYVINDIGQGQVINQDLGGSIESNQIQDTQLDVVVKYLDQIFKKAQLKSVKKPWLPSLKNYIISPHLQDFQNVSIFEEINLSVYLGLVDIPEDQRQQEYEMDFIREGHLMYIASSGYGKSIFLGTAILSLAKKNSVSLLNLYILDYGNSALIPFKRLPHVADYLTIDDDEKFEKLMNLIYQEIKVRKQKFATAMAQNFDVYNKRSSEKLKAIFLVIDNYDIVSELGYEAEAFFQKISREGAGLGIYVILTATRSNAIKYAMQSNFKMKIAGYNFEEGEVREIVGKSEYNLPEIKGRAMVKLENANMMQVYAPVKFESEVEYSERIKEVIGQIEGLCTEERATSIPILPEVFEHHTISNYPNYKEEELKVPIGIDVEELEVHYLDLSETIQLILGDSKTGKTNTIKNVIQYVLGQAIFLADSSSKELYAYREKENVTYLLETNVDSFFEEFEGKLELREETLENRKKEDPGMSPKNILSEMEHVYFIIDNFQEFLEKLEEFSGDSEVILMKAVSLGVHFIVSSGLRLRARDDFASLVKESQNGLILGNIRDQTIFSYDGYRENNNEADIGYLHVRGFNKKLKLLKSINE